MDRFDYYDYETQSRKKDYQWIKDNQRKLIEHFSGCRKVLDVACGTGLFLELLDEAGIEAVGVDREAKSVKEGKAKGLKIIQADAFDFLHSMSGDFDGFICSHFIEHLEFEKVVELIESVSAKSPPGATFVLVFPNPHSLRMQLLGFWRDPEHVRFYDAELVRAILTHYGFKVVYDNREGMEQAEQKTGSSQRTHVQIAQAIKQHDPAAASSGERLKGVGFFKRTWLKLVNPFQRLFGIKRELYSLAESLNANAAALRDLNTEVDALRTHLHTLLDQPEECVIVSRKT